MPSANDLFNMDVIGSISWEMLYFRIEVGMLFGHVDLETEETAAILKKTSCQISREPFDHTHTRTQTHRRAANCEIVGSCYQSQAQ